MSLGGERNQGKPGSPMPLGYGRGLTTSVADFASPNYEGHVKQRNYVVSGITKDSAGVALGGCTVKIFESTDSRERLVGQTVSDANGNYTVFVNSPDTGMLFQGIAYLPGSPDVAGITVNTLQGSEL